VGEAARQGRSMEVPTKEGGGKGKGPFPGREALLRKGIMTFEREEKDDGEWGDVGGSF